MEEQGAFVVIVLVFEVFASRQMETLRGALELVPALYGVRCVGAAHANVGVDRLAELRCHCDDDHHYDDDDQLA